jgi:hypothetical protein
LAPFKAAIDAMLTEDTTAPRKQRHTARRILARLLDEHGAQELSYSTVRDYVRIRRAQIDVEAGRRVEVFIPQEHAPGAEAEVDFGELWVVLNGVKTKCHMFVFRLSHSGKAIHRIYPTQAHEAFLEGHIEAFNEIGGVPVRHIRYDNLTSAVTAGCSARAGNATKTNGGCSSVRTTGLMRFIANPASRGLTKKAVSKERWAGSGATGSHPCRSLSLSMSSTIGSGPGRYWTTGGGSMTGSTPSAKTSRPSNPSLRRCRQKSSIRALF